MEELPFHYTERGGSLAGRPVQLTDNEYRVFVKLSVKAGAMMPHAELLQRVWGPAHSGRTGAGALRREEPTAQAGRRCRQPNVHLHRASCVGLPNAERRNAGAGAVLRPRRSLNPCAPLSGAHDRRAETLVGSQAAQPHLAHGSAYCPSPVHWLPVASPKMVQTTFKIVEPNEGSSALAGLNRMLHRKSSSPLRS